VKDVLRAVRDGYRNAEGKMIIDYGKTVAPIYEAYADVIEEVNVLPGCNATCAISCYRPHKVKRLDANFTLGFQRSCFENIC